MTKPRIIEQLIEKHKEKRLNKPRYKIKNLFVGEIINIVNNSINYGSSIFDTELQYTYKVIKPFAIFYCDYDSINLFYSYTHVNTKQEFRTSNFDHENGSYVINHESFNSFKNVLMPYMLQNDLNTNSKLSLNQIKELENKLNQEYYANRKNTIIKEN